MGISQYRIAASEKVNWCNAAMRGTDEVSPTFMRISHNSFIQVKLQGGNMVLDIKS